MFSKYVLFKKGHLNKRAGVWTPPLYALWEVRLYVSKTPRPTQPPTLSGMGNAYQPQCGNAMQPISKCRRGSFNLQINASVTVETV